MMYFVAITLIIYCLWLIVMLISWVNIRPIKNTTISKIWMTVIIPFRNESANLPDLINSFNKLNLQELDVEFLFVNDNSTDDFNKVFESFFRDYKILSLPEGLSGKKSAITYGVSKALGEVIVTTDADCEVQPNWLQVIRNHFQDDQVNMVFGGVTFKSDSFFDKLQLIEFAPLIGTGAASLALGQPFMCNGANLAFRKQSFNEVEGFKGNAHIASGDDEFLLYKFQNQLRGKILFVKESQAVVKTSGAKSVNTFFNQRKRWSSKWNKNLSFYKVFLALLVVFAAISTLLAIHKLVVDFDALTASLLVVKVIFEGIFISSILYFLNSPFNIFYYLLVQLVYPFYVLIFGAVANMGGYKWKDRTY